MLIKIREKAQGVFAWVILIMICVPFALWGIQNYVNVGQEDPVVSVGDKDFFQRDVSRVFQQFSQQMAQFNLPEETLKTQALDKLVRDEVLLQFVQDEGLLVTDDTARGFIRALPYFQTDDKFDKKKYQALLASQGLSSAQFVAKIRNAIVMEQFQRSVIDSSFATQYDVDHFFKIQNQQRSVDFVTVKVPSLEENPGTEEIDEYYQQHQEKYQTQEQIAIEYIELSLLELAKDIKPAESQLQAYYEERIDLYTVKERRKISHILFKFNKDVDQDRNALEKAKKALGRLKTEEFATLAKELSDDKVTAKNGGDLGLFSVGVMEQAFEDAARSLQLGEISEPIKSAFGYHLIKVTELVPSSVKAFQEVKGDIEQSYKKTEAESTFYDLAEKLAELSFENSEDLQVVSESLGLAINKTELFSREEGKGIASEEAVRTVAFSEDVLQGNNSEPIELGTERVLVLRMLEHQPGAIKSLQDVKKEIVAEILLNKAKQQTLTKATQIKDELQAGVSIEKVAKKEQLELKQFPSLTRSNGDLPWQLSQAIFKAAKPDVGKPTVSVVGLPSGEQVVLSLVEVKQGATSTADKEQVELAKNNIAKALGRATFDSVINSLQSVADIEIRQ